MKTYFKIPHAGTKALVKRREFAGPHAVDATDLLDEAFIDKLQRGDRVYGTLPVDLIAKVAAKGARYFAFVKDSGRLAERQYSESELLETGAGFREVYLELAPLLPRGFFSKCKYVLAKLWWHIRARLMHMKDAISEVATRWRILGIIAFAVLLGLLGNSVSRLLPELLPALKAVSEPELDRLGFWLQVALAVVFLVLTCFLAIWLVSRWSDGARPRARGKIARQIPAGTANSGEQLRVLIVAISDPCGFPRSAEERAIELGKFSEKLLLCGTQLAINDLRPRKGSPEIEAKYKNKWLNVVGQLVACNVDSIERIYIISDLQADKKPPTDLELHGSQVKGNTDGVVPAYWSAADYVLQMRKLILDLFSNDKTCEGGLPKPDFFWVSDAGVSRIYDDLPITERVLTSLHDVVAVQNAVALAIHDAIDDRNVEIAPNRIGIDVTTGNSPYSIAATMAALNRGVHIVHIDGKDCYRQREMALESGLFADELI